MWLLIDAEYLCDLYNSLSVQYHFVLQYHDVVSDLNEVANHRPRSTLILGSQEENARIRELQQENIELQTSVAEYQSALELIMAKYRDQVSVTALKRGYCKERILVRMVVPQSFNYSLENL